MVVLLTAVLLMVGWLLDVLNTYTRISKGILHQRQAFYACDGAERMMLKLTDDWLANGTGADVDSLREHICAQAGGCDGKLLPLIVPDDVKLTEFEITSADVATIGPLLAGPHRGLLSKNTVLTIEIRGEMDRSEPYACSMEREIVLGEVPVFQFLALSTGYADWFPIGSGDIEGRIHSNGDLCFGSGDKVRFERLSAAGGLLHTSSDDCRYSGAVRTTATQIATDSKFSTFSEWADTTSHDCEGCGGASSDWQQYARQTWRGNALDSAHGVSVLRPKVSTMPSSQFGTTADGAAVDNATGMRFLVDPPQDDDAEDVSDRRLASQAHIRIINGIWYLRDPRDPTSWPGMPIWSDHPGSMSAQDEEGVEGSSAVGQDDLASRWLWGAVRPVGYSYYGVDPTSGLLDGLGKGERAVLSYGAVVYDGISAWVPGHWVAVDNEHMCTGGTVAYGGLMGVDQSLGCVKDTARGTRLLNGTRGGFYDGHAEAGEYTDGSGHILPINLDVAALLEALQNTGTGELGSHFCLTGSGCTMDEPFNGIVYVSATWPGSLDGLGDGWPTLHPIQGENEALGDSVEAAHPSAQGALPMPLCSTDTDRVDEPLDADERFLTPSCKAFDYGGGSGGGARPNALRLINAGDLLVDQNSDTQLDIDFDADGTPDGLTIATNLPVYLLGDINTTSQVTSADDADWSSFLVAADQVTLLSSDWQDAYAPWNEEPATNSSKRIASNTTANLQILSGWAESDSTGTTGYSGGIGGFVRGLEDWSGATLTLTGSLVVGFDSVYFRWPPADDEDVVQGVDLFPMHDPHLLHWEHQPPGDVRLMAWSQGHWSRD